MERSAATGASTPAGRRALSREGHSSSSKGVMRWEARATGKTPTRPRAPRLDGLDMETPSEYSGKVCGRLHIDEFDKYYYEFQEVLAANAKAEKKRKQLEKEIQFLKELVESQNKILNSLNFDPSMLLSH